MSQRLTITTARHLDLEGSFRLFPRRLGDGAVPSAVHFASLTSLSLQPIRLERLLGGSGCECLVDCARYLLELGIQFSVDIENKEVDETGGLSFFPRLLSARA